tara:strand:- start:291 stop:512 length:222 start_codon:yes stop_codon:yes gene_type:complete
MEKTISKKAQRNLTILRNAIARGDSVSRTMKKLNLDIPMSNQISFMVRNGKFISTPMQLDLFEGVSNEKANSK